MRRQTRLIIDTILLGIIGALGAQLFTFLLNKCNYIFLNLIAGYSPPGLPDEGGILKQVIGSNGLWLIPVALIIGGIISGVLVYTFAPEAEGHGTDTAVKAFHKQKGIIRYRVAPIKILASAITIGSGGSAGREGPTALFSAGFGSIYANVTHRSPKDKRLLVLIGMAAGLSAIFRSPIGTAIFAIEVLYSEMEFEGEALVYTMLGSVIAYTINALFVGWKPLFQVPDSMSVQHVSDYLWYALLGLSSGVIGALVPSVFYKTRDFFKKIPLPPHVRPAIGAAGVGLIALAFPQVLGGGYGWIQESINGSLALHLLIILLFAKLVAFALTVSSGGSGGVFAPTLFLGAMLGGLLAKIFNQPSAAFAVIGMAAVFGSTARVPIATLLMVTEMTEGYKLLAPAALAVMLGYLVQGWITSAFHIKYISLYEAQVNNKTKSAAHREDHLRTAVRMISERRSYDPKKIGQLDFLGLLDSGIPLKLPDGKMLYMGTLSPKSICVGTQLKENCLMQKTKDVEITAIFRDEHMLMPHSGIVLEPEDQVMMLTSPDMIKILEKNFTNKSKRRLNRILRFQKKKSKDNSQ